MSAVSLTMKPIRVLADARRRIFRSTPIKVGALVLAVLLGVSGLAGVAGAPFYVFPRLDTPTSSGAVVVLGPPMVQRLMVAEDLVSHGKASRILVSVPTDWRQGDSPRLHKMCLGETQFNVTCFTPSPFTTEGEAIAVRDYLQQNDLHSVIAVTSLPHIDRARYIFDRCEGNSRVEFVSDNRQLNLGDWIYEYAYQTAAFIKAALRQGC